MSATQARGKIQMECAADYRKTCVPDKGGDNTDSSNYPAGVNIALPFFA